jgi:hypothetical protein
VATGGAEQTHSFFVRVYETVSMHAHERAANSFLRAQAIVDTVTAGKMAAAAASAAALAGGRQQRGDLVRQELGAEAQGACACQAAFACAYVQKGASASDSPACDGRLVGRREQRLEGLLDSGGEHAAGDRGVGRGWRRWHVRVQRVQLRGPVTVRFISSRAPIVGQLSRPGPVIDA